MTIINGFEIDHINYKKNDIKYAIANNDPIEEKLNVIIVISNPALFARRYILYKEFVKRMLEEETDRVNLFQVELVYGSQKFRVTEALNKTHLQLRTTNPLWHKENLVNLAVEQLLPINYKAFAWIDADVEFDSPSWALDTLKILNGCKDVVQLFSHCVDMSKDETTLNIFNGFGYSYAKGKAYTKNGRDLWHPGFAWAMTRKAYEKVGGLYDKGVLGSGDSIMALAFIGQTAIMKNPLYHVDYNDSMTVFEQCAQKLRLGYTPGIIRHYYHGSKKNRQYTERWQILIKHQYSPVNHLQYDATGLLVPKCACNIKLFLGDIMAYFQERLEDNDA